MDTQAETFILGRNFRAEREERTTQDLARAFIGFALALRNEVEIVTQAIQRRDARLKGLFN